MDEFEQLRRSQLAELDVTKPALAAWLREARAVYLWGSAEGEAAMLPSGRVRFWPAEGDAAYGARLAQGEAQGSLILAARRRTDSGGDVGEALRRRPGTADCPSCSGTGDWQRDRTVECPRCQGLGWIRAAI